jgi:hypothetical protein
LHLFPVSMSSRWGGVLASTSTPCHFPFSLFHCHCYHGLYSIAYNLVV